MRGCLTEEQYPSPLVAEPSDLAELSYSHVDRPGCAKVRTNSYSVPLKAGSLVDARMTSTMVEFRHHGKPIASCCWSRPFLLALSPSLPWQN